MDEELVADLEAVAASLARIVDALAKKTDVSAATDVDVAADVVAEPVPVVAVVDTDEPDDVDVPDETVLCPTCGQIVHNVDEQRVDTACEQRVEAHTDVVECRWYSSQQPDSERRHWATIAVPPELREVSDSEVVISGYAAVFNSPSLDMGFVERIAPGAFKRTLGMRSDVRLLVEHGGVAIARTVSETLQVGEDERGLKIEARLDPANPKVAEVLSALRRGDLDGMSFGFRTIRDSWNETRTERTLEELELFEVSLVSFPAYPATSVSARSTDVEDDSTQTSRARAVAARYRLLATD